MSITLSGKRVKHVLLVFVLISQTTPSRSETVGISIITDIKGDVWIKKEQWKQFQKAETGMTLISADQIEVKSNGLAKIYCSNQTIWEVKQGKYSVSKGCSPGSPVIKLPNSNNPTRRPPGLTEEALSKRPYLISPRETAILTNRPRIRWNAVPGTTYYTIRIDGVNWETQTNSTEIDYSGEIPLKQGWRYRVTVITDKWVSSPQENEISVGFKVLDEPTTQTVLTAATTIQQQQLSPEEKALVLVHLYRSYNLQADAVDVLEKLVNQGSQTAAVYQLLGDIYLQIGVIPLAKERYIKALELATLSGNLETQAVTQAGLGDVYNSFGNNEEAMQWWKKAKEAYQKLGDVEQVRRLEGRINKSL